MGDVKQCAWCGAKTRSECKAGAECRKDKLCDDGWGCLDHIHPNAEAVMNVAREALKPENQCIYPVGTTRDYESELAALREQLTQHAIAIREMNVTEAALREELAKSREAAKEELDGVKYTRRKFRQERDDLQQRLTAAEQRNAELEKNAARYIWLRDKSESLHQFYLSTPIWFTGVKFNPENVDSTIDAVMAQPTESGASE